MLFLRVDGGADPLSTWVVSVVVERVGSDMCFRSLGGAQSSELLCSV